MIVSRGRVNLSTRLPRARPSLNLLMAIMWVVVLFDTVLPSSTEQVFHPNVLLVVIDALRPDHLGCYGYTRPTSPTVDKLASEGVLFENAVSHAPWTKCSFSSMLTSLYPFQHGVTGWASVMPDTLIALPEVLASAGYSTACVMNAVALSGEYQVLQGFEKVTVPEKKERTPTKTSDIAIEDLSRLHRPFLLMVHYSGGHWPYRPPLAYIDLVRLEGEKHPYGILAKHRTPPLAEMPPPEELEAQKLLYDACLRYADDGVGRMIEYMEESGLLDSTLVIITADHGEAFWEHGSGLHGWSVYDELVRVPLIMRYPQVFRPGTIVPDQVQHIDLLPTIVEVTGVTDPARREGCSLVKLAATGKRSSDCGKFLPADVALCECTTPRAPATRCLRLRGWKLILESLTATRELYNLAEDPGESVNLSGRGLAVEDSLTRMLMRIPGTRLRGWRVGLLGASEKRTLEVGVAVSSGARFTFIERFASSHNAKVSVNRDSTYFRFEASGQDLNPLLFDTEPPLASVSFEIKVKAEPGIRWVYVGGEGRREIAKTFTLSPEAAVGVPEAYINMRKVGGTGICVWWLPGSSRVKGRKIELTPEQKRRLRALGYIQ